MKIDNERKLFELTNGKLRFDVLETGDIAMISAQGKYISQAIANNIDGMLGNIFLRVSVENKYKYYPLIGVKSKSKFKVLRDLIIYKGCVDGIKYSVILSMSDTTWYWTVDVTNESTSTKLIDVIYAQDLGLGDPGLVTSNEAYVGQYIDHNVLDSESGYVICSRQGNGAAEYLQQGSLTRNIAYSSDGYQFFGLKYKLDNEPRVLYSNKLDNEVYQYEFAYTALQSEEKSAKIGEKVSFVFYAHFVLEHIDAVTKIEYREEIEKNYNNICLIDADAVDCFDFVELKVNPNNVVEVEDFSEEELCNMYKVRDAVEYIDDKMVSFFTKDSSHVITREKELLVERAHGHIILSGDNNYIKENLIASTNYMYGVFNSQIVVGNTSFNKLISNTRNSLNAFKTSGQRIYIKIDGTFKLLQMPSLYEIGLNYSKWYYKLKNDLIVVTAHTSYDNPSIKLNLSARDEYEYLVTNYVIMGDKEMESPVEIIVDGDMIEFKLNDKSHTASIYPDLEFKAKIDTKFSINDDSIFYNDAKRRNEPIIVFEIEKTNEFNIVITGSVDGNIQEINIDSFDIEKQNFYKFYTNNLNNFKLTHPTLGEVSKFNHIAYWYTHNALVHYSSPHGLEQYGGAAWGTRDVCQGPIEYFMTTQNFEIVRDILIKIYSHQYIQDGNWPQWFMFDKFHRVQHHESHGDVIVWPLRALAYYLKATNDFAILDEEIKYIDKDTYDYSVSADKMIIHLKKQLETIKSNFIKGTHLSCYGDGDWDDTLQPANSELRKKMVSGWTVALTFETFKTLSEVLVEYDSKLANELDILSDSIKIDYMKYVVKDNVPSGFLYFGDNEIKSIIHPTDSETNMKYRLLPFNRGLISEMFEKENVETYYNIIRENLYHPDGVRLMNNTVNYSGGVNTYFKRAETAANFGREIGLQYVHAHIRFVEAMAKIGKSSEVWDGLMKINPIGIKDVVKNAEIRQSNTYFSSSDGKFNDRYEAMSEFDKLRTGDVDVKGGWRIYSSGPGIYLNQLISNCLGVRVEANNLVLDPVLPKRMNNLEFTYKYLDKDIIIRYKILNDDASVRKVIINNSEIDIMFNDNKYRTGGAVINGVILEKLMVENQNIVIIEME